MPSAQSTENCISQLRQSISWQRWQLNQECLTIVSHASQTSQLTKHWSHSEAIVKSSPCGETPHYLLMYPSICLSYCTRHNSHENLLKNTIGVHLTCSGQTSSSLYCLRKQSLTPMWGRSDRRSSCSSQDVILIRCNKLASMCLISLCNQSKRIDNRSSTEEKLF